MTPKNSEPIHPALKQYAGFSPDTPDEVVRDYFSNVFPGEIEKPCISLMWCPYGPLVEQFPLDDGSLHDNGTFGFTAIAEPAGCAVFGHDCPVYYVAEPLMDTKALVESYLCEECLAKQQSERPASPAAMMAGLCDICRSKLEGPTAE